MNNPSNYKYAGPAKWWDAKTVWFQVGFFFSNPHGGSDSAVATAKLWLASNLRR